MVFYGACVLVVSESDTERLCLQEGTIGLSRMSTSYTFAKCVCNYVNLVMFEVLVRFLAWFLVVVAPSKKWHWFYLSLFLQVDLVFCV